jgi:hypothetical protein
MQHTFTLDQRVYSADGRAGMYVAEVVGGHAVQPLFEDGDGVTEPATHYAEGIEVWPSVHAEPPRALLDAAIAERRAALAKLQAEVADLERSKREAMRDRSEVLARLAQHEELRYLDNFLNATITHYVMQIDGEWVVLDTAAFCQARSLSYSERVLTLTARVTEKGKALHWMVKTSSDYPREIFAFPDEQQAKEKACGQVSNELKRMHTELLRGNQPWNADSALKNASALGMEPPAELLQALRELHRKQAQALLDKAQQDAAIARAALLKIDGEPAAA